MVTLVQLADFSGLEKVLLWLEAHDFQDPFSDSSLILVAGHSDPEKSWVPSANDERCCERSLLFV